MLTFPLHTATPGGVVPSPKMSLVNSMNCIGVSTSVHARVGGAGKKREGGRRGKRGRGGGGEGEGGGGRALVTSECK
jgi:hypothetical protein